MKVIHVKTGNIYVMTGERINATNEQSGQVMVEYEREGKKYVRESNEFWEAFEAV